jgi:glycosyltransferase involved in cell wall biosynthesis
MVVIEAFACGVPVVTVRAKYNAAQGLVEDGVNGFVVGPEEKEIAEGVEKILENGNHYEEMAASAFKRARKYEWNTVFEQLLLQYLEIKK